MSTTAIPLALTFDVLELRSSSASTRHELSVPYGDGCTITRFVGESVDEIEFEKLSRAVSGASTGEYERVDEYGCEVGSKTCTWVSQVPRGRASAAGDGIVRVIGDLREGRRRHGGGLCYKFCNSGSRR